MTDLQKDTGAVLLEAKDLPVYCPNPSMPMWSSHPRLFLDMTAKGEAKCPYCGTVYGLKPGVVLKAH
ncbi:MAG: zinc-finger domain-containing protein [Pseudomonadota bacterium]